MTDTGKRVTAGRRHVTTACASCRDDKIKCNGTRPFCDQCADKKRQCVYNVKVDKRKISLRKTIETFSRRVWQLENVMASLGLDVPQPPNEEDSSMLDVLMTAYAPSAHLEQNIASESSQSPASPDDSMPVPFMESESCLPAGTRFDSFGQPETDMYHLVGQHAQAVKQPEQLAILNDNLFSFDTAVDDDWVWNLSTVGPVYPNSDPEIPASLASDIPRQAVRPDSNIDDLSLTTLISDEDSADDDDCSEITGELSARLGTLLSVDTGERRFYGATSNLHLMGSRHTFKQPSCLQIQQLQLQFQVRLDHAGVGQTVGPDLSAHLVNLYFAWQNPSLYIVDKQAFETARDGYIRENCDSNFYSEVLVNAMCAVGAAFERSRQPGYPFPLAEFFANRAKALLDLELDFPRVATVQSLAILSIHEAAVTRDTRGWLFSGMAIRLALDLGLHVSPKQYVEDGSMSVEEADVRRITFWGTFATDRMWGLYLGRPFNTTLDDNTVEKPSLHLGQPDLGVWHAYDDLTQKTNGIFQPNPQHILSDRWIALYEIMSPLGHSLYFKADASNIELQALAQHTFEGLQKWRSGLPGELVIDMHLLSSKDYLPHVLMLHMQYALFVIILHRPFVAKHYIQPNPPIGNGPRHAREMCLRSSVDIALLIRAYERQYALQRASILLVHIASTASLILIYAIISENNTNSQNELATQLDMCCHALAELGNSFENAARTLGILLSIKRMWQARLVAGLRTKRPNAHTSSFDMARKRAKGIMGSL